MPSKEGYYYTISIHAPRAGSDFLCQNSGRRERISIHAPRAGSDETTKIHEWMAQAFQSTPPVRGATRCNKGARGRHVISIHAPRAGSDRAAVLYSVAFFCISIHAPRAGSDIPQTMSGMSPAIFQSTPPVRGATPLVTVKCRIWHISIHAPRAGSDRLQH